MVYTKDGKNYHTPIKIVKDNKVIYTNDPELIAEAGYNEYVKPTVPLSVRIQQSDDAEEVAAILVSSTAISTQLDSIIGE